MLPWVLRLAPDLDAVEALSPEREALWARMERASFLTDDEKRAAVGIEYRNAPVYVGFMNLPDLVDQWQPTTRRAVARFERLAGVRLPDDYREFLLATNGGTPLVPDFEVPALAPKGRRSISFFHGLDSPWSGCDLRVAMELVRAHKTPRGLVPIAAAWLNTVFLDLRDGKCGVGYRDNRSMLLDCDWREHEFYRVADTFEGFLLGLRPEPPRRTRLRRRNGKVVLPRVNAYAPPTTKAAVARLERHMGVRLPRLYKEFLLHANGGRPLRPQFTIEGMAGNRSGGVENFFGVASARWTDDLQQTFDWFRGGVPPGIVMIANCGECLYLCLDLREDSESVLLWDNRHFWGTGEWRAQDLYRVADDVEAFLAGLQPEPL